MVETKGTRLHELTGQVISQAGREAERQSSSSPRVTKVSTGHLLLALCTIDSIAKEVLLASGVTYSTVSSALAHIEE